MLATTEGISDSTSCSASVPSVVADCKIRTKMSIRVFFGGVRLKIGDQSSVIMGNISMQRKHTKKTNNCKHTCESFTFC